MNKIILDGKDFKTKEELHKVLKEELELPEYYGENLDALWDCLTGWIDLPMEVMSRNGLRKMYKTGLCKFWKIVLTYHGSSILRNIQNW